MLKQMCEFDLYDRFDKGLRQLELEKHSIYLLKGSGQVAIQVIDFHQFAGCKIDRRENKKDGIKEVTSFMLDVPNFSFYMPRNPMELTKALFGGKTD